MGAEVGVAIGWVLLVVVNFGAGLLFLVGLFARRAGEPAEARSWAAAYAVPLTEANRAMVTYAVQLTIMLRVTGGVFGLFIAYLVDPAFGLHTRGLPSILAWVVAGWTVGSVWADRSVPRPVTQPGATLVPRGVADYLSAGMRAAPVFAAVAVVALGVVGIILGGNARAPRDLTAPADLVAMGVLAVLVAVAALLLIRSTVARRQPVMHPDIARVDDALRSGVAHHISGGATAILMFLAAQVVHSVAAAQAPSYGIEISVPLALLVAGLVAWRFLAHLGWRVQRPGSLATSPPAVERSAR